MKFKANFPLQRLCTIYLSILVLALSSCMGTRNVLKKSKSAFNYFQEGLDSVQKIVIEPLTIKPSDVLNIHVSSGTLNQEQAAVFNAANYGGSLGGGAGGSSMMPQQQMGGTSTIGFIVDEAGKIKYPMIGTIAVNGLTRQELEKLLEDTLENRGLVKLPMVQVRFLQLKVTVLGEVGGSGTKSFNNDRITILDALSAAGDLTIRGRRDSIAVIRLDNQGITKTYYINLLNTNFMSQKAFQLQQNDIVYVRANKIKLKETKYDPSFMRDFGIGMQLVSAALFLINLFVLFKK